MLVTASSLATILLKHFGVRSQQAHQLIDRCPLYVSKERALHRKIFRGSKKVRIRMLGRCWCLVQLSRFIYQSLPLCVFDSGNVLVMWASHCLFIYGYLLCEMLIMTMHIYLFIYVYQVFMYSHVYFLSVSASIQRSSLHPADLFQCNVL